MTVDQLIEQLAKLPEAERAKEVKVWLPGSTLSLACVFVHKGNPRIEGNVDEGSALEALLR